MVLYESMIPQDRRGEVASLIRDATVTCTARKKFYAYAALHGLDAAADALAIQPGVDAAAVARLREAFDEARNDSEGP